MYYSPTRGWAGLIRLSHPPQPEADKRARQRRVKRTGEKELLNIYYNTFLDPELNTG